MARIRLALLRGVCQMPAYVAHHKGYFADEGLEAEVDIAPTAWLVPQQLIDGAVDFAVIPWTRIAAGASEGLPLKVICGSGVEEAAIVLRRDVDPDQVRAVGVPQEGGMKDLTAMGLIERLGWSDAKIVRSPSGDGTILALIGEAVDAASMVEPWASMLEELGVGRVLQRTGDVWPGAPGCSLTTTDDHIQRDPPLVQAVVRAFVRGARHVAEAPDEAADIAARYIAVDARFVRCALRSNRPDVLALHNQAAMDTIIDLMLERGYIALRPGDYADLRFVEAIREDSVAG